VLRVPIIQNKMKIDLANIATNEKRKLNGFKILGLFPFYVHYVTVATHIKLCKIQEQFHKIKPDGMDVNDFYNSALQEKIEPYIYQYCITALVNERMFGWFYKFLLSRKIKKSGHLHILNLYLTIQQLNEPAFFLSYWKLLLRKENTLLKEEKQS